jgi:predicted outer membrane repeat protein
MRKLHIFVLLFFAMLFSAKAQLHVSAYPFDKFKVIGPPSGGPTQYESSGVGVIQKFLTKSGDGRWYIIYKGTGAFYYAYRSSVNPNNNPPCCDVWEIAAPSTATTDPWVGAGTAPLTLTGFTCENVIAINKYYVDHTASPGGSGLSWATAFTNLQAALDVISDCNDEIYIAKGTYIPSKDITGSTTGSPKLTFYINKNVKIYGGYPNGGAGLRDTKLNLTSLSGNNFAENVITMRASPTLGSISNQTVIDGLTIEKGNYLSSIPTTGFFTNGAGLNIRAEGFNITCSPTINDCIFSNNVAYTGGGAIYMQPTNLGACSPIITKTKFINNVARAQGLLTGGDASIANSGGGAVRMFETVTMVISYSVTNFSGPQFIDCDFENNQTNGLGGALNFSGNTTNNPIFPFITNAIFNSNTAGYSGTSSDGGAIYNKAAGSKITNSVFAANHSFGRGASIFNQNSSSFGGNEITNCTFHGNIPDLGANIDNNSSSLTIKNSILWGNSSEISDISSTTIVSYSDVQGGFIGTGNINADPLFVNTLDPDGTGNIWRTPDDGLNITTGSPAINSGDPATTTPPSDITNIGRVGTFDMGAYEGGCLTLPLPTVTYSTGFRPQGNINLNCIPSITVTNSSIYDVEVMQFGDANISLAAGTNSTILPNTNSRSIYQLKYKDYPACTYDYYPIYAGSPHYSQFYDFRNGFIRKVNSAPAIIINSPYAIVSPNPSGICAGNNLNLKVISDSYGDWITSLQVFDGNSITNLSSQLTPYTNAPQNISMGVLNSNKTLIFKTLTVDFEYIFSGSGVPMWELSCPISVTASPAPCVQPVATISGMVLPAGMYISICNGSAILQTSPYSGTPIALNAISGAGTYTIVLHQTPGGSCSPSIPSGFTIGSESIGSFTDTNTNGRLTFTLDASGNLVGSTSRINADNDIVFSLLPSSPLPIKLISFEAKAQEKHIQLTWKTASETNSAGYDIERSENGKDFTKIGYVKSVANNGNSNEQLGYAFTDETPIEGNNFYRLKQLDLDGKFAYSAIKSVKMENEETVKVYPNPSSDFINIETNSNSKIKNIQLVNAKGSVVYHSNLFENKIDISNQPLGIYFLKIEETSGKITLEKVLKN